MATAPAAVQQGSAGFSTEVPRSEMSAAAHPAASISASSTTANYLIVPHSFISADILSAFERYRQQVPEKKCFLSDIPRKA